MAKSSDKVAFLGPEGTFTEEALLANMPDGGLHPFPYPSIPDVLRAVQAGEAHLVARDHRFSRMAVHAATMPTSSSTVATSKWNQ